MILQQYSVPSTFLEILLAFGDKPSNGAAGSAKSAILRQRGSEFSSYSINLKALKDWRLTCHMQVFNTICHISSSPMAVERKISGTGQHGKSVFTSIT